MQSLKPDRQSHSNQSGSVAQINSGGVARDLRAAMRDMQGLARDVRGVVGGLHGVVELEKDAFPLLQENIRERDVIAWFGVAAEDGDNASTAKSEGSSKHSPSLTLHTKASSFSSLAEYSWAILLTSLWVLTSPMRSSSSFDPVFASISFFAYGFGASRARCHGIATICTRGNLLRAHTRARVVLKTDGSMSQ
jgi:hypothetical protein